MYNPYASPDMTNEQEVLSKGRLVKVRFLNQPAPNVDWFWIPVGNCHACRFYAPSTPDSPRVHCQNPDISDDDFNVHYMHSNDCPGYSVGISAIALTEDGWQARLDVMRAAGLLPGKPSQPIAVIVNEPWSIPLSLRAHREESIFLAMAMQADSGNSNDPHTNGEYVDMEDDLERPSDQPPKAPDPDEPDNPDAPMSTDAEDHGL